MSKVTSLDHIAIATPNLEEALKFYRDALGLQVAQTEVLEERGIRVAFLPIGDTRLELIEPLHDKSEVSRFLEKRGGGIHHLAFSTPDVDQHADDLKAQGVRMTGDVSMGAHNCKVAFIHPKASGGTLIEISTSQDVAH